MSAKVESDYDTGWREGYEAASGIALMQIERLREALEQIAETEGNVHPSWHVQTAREALKSVSQT